MLKTKEQAINDVVSNYQELNSFRKNGESMIIYEVEESSYTKAALQREGVIYISGDTRDPNFWRIVRNEAIRDVGSNDDFQFDEYALTLQRDLITEGLLGWVKIALIGADETLDTLTMYGVSAIEDGYVPVSWNWCHTYWMIDDDVKNYHKSMFSGYNLPISRVWQLPGRDEAKTEEVFLRAISDKIEKIVHEDKCAICKYNIDLGECLSKDAVGIITFEDCSGAKVGFETYSRYFLDMALLYIANLLSII